MYVYYIAMEIYVFNYKNIFSSFYCLCIINIVTPYSYHELNTNTKPFQNKNLSTSKP